jgi:hypothetical protein
MKVFLKPALPNTLDNSKATQGDCQKTGQIKYMNHWPSIDQTMAVPEVNLWHRVARPFLVDLTIYSYVADKHVPVLPAMGCNGPESPAWQVHATPNFGDTMDVNSRWTATKWVLLLQWAGEKNCSSCPGLPCHIKSLSSINFIDRLVGPAFSLYRTHNF